jgi:hypothetical protein
MSRLDRRYRGRADQADQFAGAAERSADLFEFTSRSANVVLAGPHWLAWLDLTRPESELPRQLPAGSGSDYSAVRRVEDESRKHASRDRLWSPETIARRAFSKIMLPKAAR